MAKKKNPIARRHPHRREVRRHDRRTTGQGDRRYRGPIAARAARAFQTHERAGTQSVGKGKEKNWPAGPKLGKHGTRIVSVTVEKSLLKRADAYAKANGIKRSELFARSLSEKIGAGEGK